jgi:hypothetical protein
MLRKKTHKQLKRKKYITPTREISIILAKKII